MELAKVEIGGGKQDALMEVSDVEMLDAKVVPHRTNANAGLRQMIAFGVLFVLFCWRFGLFGNFDGVKNLLGIEIECITCACGPCANGGACANLTKAQSMANGGGAGEDKFTCACKPGSSGERCQTDANECLSAPCSNGGDCMESRSHGIATVALGAFKCACAAGWQGRNCSSDIDECKASPPPCKNGGRCAQTTIGKLNCTCAKGFRGELCTTDIDECASSPCKNGAQCSESKSYLANCKGGGTACALEAKVAPDAYKCACVKGWTGFNCATDIDECASSPCKNGAKCVTDTTTPVVDAYTCTGCRKCFNGTNCERPACQGVGSKSCDDPTKTSALKDFQCNCNKGYTGRYCKGDLDECASSPCLYGSKCSTDPSKQLDPKTNKAAVIKLDSYVCLGCPQGRSGKNCQIDTDECKGKIVNGRQIDSCKNGATCSESSQTATLPSGVVIKSTVALGEFTCKCKKTTGWSDKTCSTCTKGWIKDKPRSDACGCFGSWCTSFGCRPDRCCSKGCTGSALSCCKK